jgi:hypothetical protein
MRDSRAYGLTYLLAAVLAASCGGSDDAPLAPAATAVPACGIYEPPAEKPAPAPVTVVQLPPTLPPPLQLAAAACAGLQNRQVGGSVYLDADPHDLGWMTELGISPAATVGADDLLSSCVASFPACVRYDYGSQKALLPSILTVAAALGAVPVDGSLGVACEAPSFDATVEFAGKSPAEATALVFEKFGAQTTGLAMLNPGYELAPKEPSSPALNGEMKPALVDLVFAEKLFVVFLVNGCIAGDPEREVLSTLVNSGTWPSPVAVYGYNNAWNVGGGYLYEAQTRCLDSRNMGAVASEVPNLSFFSTRAPAITKSGALVPNPPEDVAYDASKTYVAFVVGDGDNIHFMLTTRRDWFQERIAECAAGPEACPPLSWSASSHLLRLGPDVLGWYYAKARQTQRDFFVLPPSGHLYAYPSSLADPVQDAFVAATENDACVLGLTGTVHWDWAGTWRDAEDHFLPKYARKDGIIRGIFPTNVPFAFPTFTWWPEEQFYRVLKGQDGGATAVFRPRQWRGIDSETNPFRLTPQKMADEIAGYPRGTITWVYMTSDGGLTLANSFLTLLKMLPPHVQLVSTDTAARLAIDAWE